MMTSGFLEVVRGGGGAGRGGGKSPVGRNVGGGFCGNDGWQREKTAWGARGRAMMTNGFLEDVRGGGGAGRGGGKSLAGRNVGGGFCGDDG